MALAQSFPQLGEFQDAVAALLTNAADSGNTIAAAEAKFRRQDTKACLGDIVVPAFSRLSESTRKDRLALTQSRDVVADFERQVEELNANTERMREEHIQVVTPLRDELASLQQGNIEPQQ